MHKHSGAVRLKKKGVGVGGLGWSGVGEGGSSLLVTSIGRGPHTPIHEQHCSSVSTPPSSVHIGVCNGRLPPSFQEDKRQKQQKKSVHIEQAVQ